MGAPRDYGGPPPILDVPPLAVELGERFRAAGFELYLVGGAVRDLLLQRPARDDLDFATNAHPDETTRVLQEWGGRPTLRGVRFGTVGTHKQGVVIEITTFRKEVYPEDDRH